MSEKIYLYPVWTRLWHWINAILFIILIVTGVSMQYSDPETPLIPFEPSVAWHNVAGIILAFNYLFFVIGNIVTWNGKYYKLKTKGLMDRIMKQSQYYLFGVFKGEKPPFPENENRKFNPLQKVAYLVTMYVATPLVILSGVALLFPEMIVNKVFGVSGTLLTALLHMTMGFFLSVFILIHVYFSTFGNKISSHFKSMIDGYHEKH
ncbi:MAG: cytochrome b/b6 domain-containing protein [Bacteroidales bacterium]|nr:cytochrome b/b6 domain-containing protein [Bacteroidales bacterium]